MSCEACRALEAELAEAERSGNRTKAVDCRVLLRRHPRHDGVPVESVDSAARGGVPCRMSQEEEE
ncbi:hypothetical protein [Streptomyces lydicus]|uniref:hypothetical protein n=1 Tax=Streptomyces lydicus TaxID=47763 RepID=UPI0036EF783D